MANAWIVVMAGGVGSRFWPQSRSTSPKQLLPLVPGDKRPLLVATLERTKRLVPLERTLIVTGESLAKLTKDALDAESSRTGEERIPDQNILAEPTGRNTAPCIGWAASFIARHHPEDILVVLPADHHIADEDTYQETLKKGIEAAGKGHLVTVGIRPTRPETGYGYLELSETTIEDGVIAAKRFVEKPNAEKAQSFLDAGNFLWNSGMFFFRADTVLKEIQSHLPELSKGLLEYDKAAANGHEMEAVKATYHTLPSISVDHGIMEKAAQVAVIPASFGWSDLGSWLTSWEMHDKDEDLNASDTDQTIFVESKGCLVQSSSDKVVALVGVENLVVVDTGDALLVMPRDRAQDVRQVVSELKSRNDSRV